jgi:hypothetical protein
LNSFGYLSDPLFLVTCSLYVLNRWFLKPHVHNLFLHGYFNDLLLIPCALPPLLLMQRWLRLRTHDQAPGWIEIALNLVVWSILFEVIGPKIMPWTVGDPWDVVAYTAGALVAGLWWQRRVLTQRLRFNEL